MSPRLAWSWVRARRALFPFAAVVLAAGIAVGVEGAGLGPFSSLACGVAAGLLAGGGAGWIRGRRLAAEQAAAERAAARARHEAAWRLFWEASSDFVPGAWGRHDLETLRLLALNLAPGAILGERVTRRLRDAVSRVLASVLDRLGDVLVTARQLEGEHRAVARLEEAIPHLLEQLEGVSCVPGEAVPFDPRVVAGACAATIEACDLLRRELGRRVLGDLRAALGWLGNERFAGQVARGDLVLPGPAGVEAPPGSGRLLVVARAPDLVASFGEALDRALDLGDPVGPVRVTLAEGEDGSARVTVSWRTADRLAVEPAKVVHPLQVLRAWGARVRVEEQPREDRIRLVVELETVGDARERGAAAGSEPA